MLTAFPIFGKFSDGQQFQFLMAQGDDDDAGWYLFSTEGQLDLARKSRIFVMDGTFKSAPKKFQQLYTVHCQHESGEFLPCVHLLLPSEKEKIYTEAFAVIRSLLLQTDGTILPSVHTPTVYAPRSRKVSIGTYARTMLPRLIPK